MFAANLAQTSLTNWAAGGQNSVAINCIFSVFANMKQGKSVWDNSLDLGYGVLKQGKKGEDANFSAFVAPLTAKFTFVTDKDLDVTKFGIESGKTTRSEIGGYIRAIFTKNDFKSELMKNISFTTKIDLFSNYAENPQNIDVSWETLIAMKVNKYITINFNTHLLYDDNIKILVAENESVGSLVQFKEIFGVGLSYKF